MAVVIYRERNSEEQAEKPAARNNFAQKYCIYKKNRFAKSVYKKFQKFRNRARFFLAEERRRSASLYRYASQKCTTFINHLLLIGSIARPRSTANRDEKKLRENERIWFLYFSIRENRRGPSASCCFFPAFIFGLANVSIFLYMIVNNFACFEHCWTLRIYKLLCNVSLI